MTQFHVLADKLDEFLEAARAAAPHAREQKGFRALLLLREDAGASSAHGSIYVRVISLWNSIEDLQAAEQNFYLYQALARVMTASKGFLPSKARKFFSRTSEVKDSTKRRKLSRFLSNFGERSSNS